MYEMWGRNIYPAFNIEISVDYEKEENKKNDNHRNASLLLAGGMQAE